MILVRCKKCGCEYTMPDNCLSKVYKEERKCPGCKTLRPFDNSTNINDLVNGFENFKLYYLPDDESDEKSSYFGA